MNEPGLPFVSHHAIVRYVERVLETDPAEVTDEQYDEIQAKIWARWHAGERVPAHHDLWPDANEVRYEESEGALYLKRQESIVTTVDVDTLAPNRLAHLKEHTGYEDHD